MAANNHNTGHPVMDIVLAVGGSLVSILFAVLDHFFSPIGLEYIDIIFGWIVKAFALTASIYTIRLVRKKLKDNKKNTDGKA